MKNKLLPLLVIAAMMFSSCENTIDDRERSVPADPSTAWLLSVQLTKIPQDGLYYSCVEMNTANPQPEYMHTFVTDTTITSKDLPILWKIEGGQLLNKEDEMHAISIMSIEPETGNQTILLNQPIPTLNQLRTYPSDKYALHFPTRLHYEENGVECTLIFRYD